MNPTDPLAELRGLHLPDPVSFWPPAPGWWMVAGFALAVVVTTAIVVAGRRRSLARHALREVARVEASTAGVQDTAAALAELMRRVAIQRFGAERVAALHGADWERFLVGSGPPRGARRRPALDAASGRLLALAPYAPPRTVELRCEAIAVERAHLVRAAKRWIRENA